MYITLTDIGANFVAGAVNSADVAAALDETGLKIEAVEPNALDLHAWLQRLRPACLVSPYSTYLLGRNVFGLPAWLQRLRFVCLASTSATCLLGFSVFDLPAMLQRLRLASLALNNVLAASSSTCLLGFNVCDLPAWLSA